MENTNDVIQDSSSDQAVDATSEGVITPTDSAPIKTEEKVVPYSRFKEVHDELEKYKKQPVKVINKALNVEDYIDISASLEGLDQREKEYLAQQHKYTGMPLSEIRKNEDFLLWQGAHRNKVEKEKLTLAPSSKQSESDQPRSLNDRLSTASLEEKEAILTKAGLYKTVRPRSDKDRAYIGPQR